MDLSKKLESGYACSHCRVLHLDSSQFLTKKGVPRDLFRKCVPNRQTSLQSLTHLLDFYAKSVSVICVLCCNVANATVRNSGLVDAFARVHLGSHTFNYRRERKTIKKVSVGQSPLLLYPDILSLRDCTFCWKFLSIAQCGLNERLYFKRLTARPCYVLSSSASCRLPVHSFASLTGSSNSIGDVCCVFPRFIALSTKS